MALIMLTRKRLPVPLMTGVWPTGAHDRPAAASERTPISSSHNTTPPSRLARARRRDRSRPASAPPRPGSAPGPPPGLLGAEPPPTQISAHRRARQPHAIAPGDQLGDRLTGPQQPRQAELVRGAFANSCDDLLL